MASTSKIAKTADDDPYEQLAELVYPVKNRGQKRAVATPSPPQIQPTTNPFTKVLSETEIPKVKIGSWEAPIPLDEAAFSKLQVLLQNGASANVSNLNFGVLQSIRDKIFPGSDTFRATFSHLVIHQNKYSMLHDSPESCGRAIVFLPAAVETTKSKSKKRSISQLDCKISQIFAFLARSAPKFPKFSSPQVALIYNLDIDEAAERAASAPVVASDTSSNSLEIQSIFRELFKIEENKGFSAGYLCQKSYDKMPTVYDLVGIDADIYHALLHDYHVEVAPVVVKVTGESSIQNEGASQADRYFKEAQREGLAIDYTIFKYNPADPPKRFQRNFLMFGGAAQWQVDLCFENSKRMKEAEWEELGAFTLESGNVDEQTGDVFFVNDFNREPIQKAFHRAKSDTGEGTEFEIYYTATCLVIESKTKEN